MKKEALKSQWLLVSSVILILLITIFIWKSSSIKRHLEFYFASVVLDTKPYTLTASCDKFFATRKEAEDAKDQIKKALSKDSEISQLLEDNRVFIEIIDPVVNDRDCQRKIAIEVSYPSHKAGTKIKKILQKEGFLDKYVINLTNM